MIHKCCVKSAARRLQPHSPNQLNLKALVSSINRPHVGGKLGWIQQRMQLEYYYLVFEEDAEQCPKELWESILEKLSVVFSVYGFSKATSDIHELYAICEDNSRLTLYEGLPANVKIKLRQKRKDIIDLKGFTKFLKPVLLREEGLNIKDNTKALFDIDDDD